MPQDTSTRRLEGKEGAGSHQEGPVSVKAGKTQKRERSTPEKERPKVAGNKPAKRKSGR